MSNNDESPRIIETASATTSPDNSNSGSFAYVLTAVTLGVVLVLSLIGAGCASVVLSSMAKEETSSSSNENGFSSPFDDWDDQYTDDDFDINNMDFNDLLNDYTNGFPNSGNKDGGNSKTTTAGEALDFSLAPYGNVLDDEVSASSYAGAPAEVRDFVRNIVSVDKDYSNRLVTLLDAAALKEDERMAKIQEAVTLCGEAKNAVNGVEIPQVANDANGAVRDALGAAKSEAVRRWELMETEISMLNTTESIRTNRLWDADDDVLAATEGAGDMLEEAMGLASNPQ